MSQEKIDDLATNSETKIAHFSHKHLLQLVGVEGRVDIFMHFHFYFFLSSAVYCLKEIMHTFQCFKNGMMIHEWSHLFTMFDINLMFLLQHQ